MRLSGFLPRPVDFLQSEDAGFTKFVGISDDGGIAVKRVSKVLRLHRKCLIAYGRSIGESLKNFSGPALRFHTTSSRRRTE